MDFEACNGTRVGQQNIDRVLPVFEIQIVKTRGTENGRRDDRYGRKGGQTGLSINISISRFV
jgi:hypothetical protein